MKAAFALGALAVCLVPVLAGMQGRSDVPAPPPCLNVITHEPLLVYEVVGSALYEQYDFTLTLYNDGSIKLADAYATAPHQCLRAQIPTREAWSFYQSVVMAGAFSVCDDPRTMTDVALHTVTMLDPFLDMPTHTFSYWIGDGSYAPIDALLTDFIAAQFPRY